MKTFTIAVVASRGQESEAEAIRLRLSEAWSYRLAVSFTTARLELLDADRAERPDAIVLMTEAASSSQVQRQLAVWEELHVPVIVLLDALPEPGNVFEHAGALVVERGGDARALCAHLRALLHRQREVDQLHREIAMARRSQGGLRGEISRIHEELQLAAIAQREFLPSTLPVLHGVTLAALWRPANYVSGDIYDVIQLDQDRLGLFLADAVGHGVPAALMTIVICQSLVTRELEGSSWRILPPAEVLARLNTKLMRGDNQPTRFATAVYAVLDCRSRLLTLAGAGHPPPLLLGGDGQCRAIQTAGGLLGVFQDERYDQIEVPLTVGDRLLIYSDGFEQAFPESREGRRLPSARYREEFERLGALGSPRAMIEAISTRLDCQSGSLHQIDDLTLICMHAGPLVSAEPARATEPMHA